MIKTSRITGRAHFRSIRPSKALCLLLVSMYLPCCTAESITLPSAPVPAGVSAVMLPAANLPAGQQQTTTSTPPQAQTLPAQNSPAAADEQQSKQPAQSTTGNQSSGVAAAPYIRPEGVSGSEPAGAAIAPAKQRRRRIFALRLGLIIGAAIAVGTVVALSRSSPSRAN